MKVYLCFGSPDQDIKLDINQKSSPTEQVKQALQQKNIPLLDLKEIRFEIISFVIWVTSISGIRE